jgi:hypothetical protein
MDALTLHRFHFGFTITYHYLFPQLTMGFHVRLPNQNQTFTPRFFRRAWPNPGSLFPRLLHRLSR